VRAAPQEEYDDQPRGFWTRLKDKFTWGEYEDEEELVDEPGSPKKPSVLRVQQARMHYVSVWRTLLSLDNAQQAADGLKEGHQQIVNLEKASPELRDRIKDFLNGVTYALDGYVEKVGESVYLYTPRNYCIEVENEETGRRVQSPFNEN